MEYRIPYRKDSPRGTKVVNEKQFRVWALRQSRKAVRKVKGSGGVGANMMRIKERLILMEKASCPLPIIQQSQELLARLRIWLWGDEKTFRQACFVYYEELYRIE